MANPNTNYDGDPTNDQPGEPGFIKMVGIEETRLGPMSMMGEVKLAHDLLAAYNVYAHNFGLAEKAHQAEFLVRVRIDDADKSLGGDHSSVGIIDTLGLIDVDPHLTPVTE